uniref:NAD(P)-binding protein n=1 Tax=Panagrellus redivivus TaxID=6233 RepID=A0A7E4VW55_PANRE
MMGRFKNKVVIVTGSSGGIGKAVIHAFAKEGAYVVLHGVNTERLNAAEKSLLEAGTPQSRILKVQGELTNDATHDRIINETIARFCKIDVLINNAGAYQKPGAASAIENFDYVFSTNVRAVFRLVELATPHLAKTKGNIINVSSIVGLAKNLEAGTESLVYAMTKAAVDRYTKNVNQSLMKKGVRINNINPGPFDSNFGTRGVGEVKKDTVVGNKDFMEKLMAKVIPAGRLGQPEELIPAFLLLADKKSSFITGSIWVIDGGLSTWAPEATDLKL